MEQRAGWCVVVSKPMAEEVAAKAIRERGYRSYLPMSSKRITGTHAGDDGRRHRRRSEMVMRPAFRGYLFAELHPGQSWGDLLDSRITRGVADIIMHGERPALLSLDLINAIAEHERLGEFDEPRGLRCRAASRRRADLEDGATVRIGDGPFSGFLASLVNQDDQGRAALLVNIFGRDTSVQWTVDALELVSRC